MRNPPDEIDVLGKPWQIINNNKYCKKNKVFGLTDECECRLYYTTDTTPSQLRDTLLHELLHTLDLSLGLGLKERQVHALSAVLYGTFTGNPEFTRWLLGKIIEGNPPTLLEDEAAT